MKRHGHWLGWTALATVVAVADYYSERSMSDGFKSLARDRRTMPVMIGLSLYVNAHLFGLIPDKYDLFHRVRGYVRTIPDAVGFDCCRD